MLRTTLAVVVLTPFGFAQLGGSPYRDVDLKIDSGPGSNSGAGWEVVLAETVEVDGASSLRLELEGVKLSGSPARGTDSIVRITSLLDGAVQHHTAATLEQWGGHTAFFNGDSVLVEVLAHPGTGTNRFSVARAEAQLEPLFPASICGADDDRQPSDDARVARIQPATCTAWLIDDSHHGALTAGHCASFGAGYNPGDLIEFDVPFSTPSGMLVHPPPSEQYAIDLQSEQGIWGPIGNDWWYFGVFQNTETGLWPYEAQGDWFTLQLPPASASGQTIRITGHGSDSTPLSYDNVQQTHTGDMVESGQVLRYTADTTGGNSGSPVIWEEQGVAIGIHTNGGCFGAGGSNSGTGLSNPAIQNALEDPQGVLNLGAFGGPFENLGKGLGQGSFLPPLLTASGDLTPGSDFRLAMGLNYNLSAAVGLIVFGNNQVDTPFAGGVIVPEVEVVLVGVPIQFQGGYGLQVWETNWPAAFTPGLELVIQTWVVTPDLPQDQLLASNGLRITVP